MTQRPTIQRPLAQACFAGAMLALVAFPAFAQDADPAIDTNADGNYSFPELQATNAALTDETFTAMDTNGDGLLDMAEVVAATEAGLIAPTEG